MIDRAPSLGIILSVALAFACKPASDEGESSDSTGSDSTGSDSTGSDSTGSDSTDSTDSTTGVDVSGFERFRLSRGAGPCPPDADCDGFVEILAPQLLRVEEFGDVTDAVTEVQLSAEDFAAAALVFSDPALWALLDDPSLDCNPPTDVFEGMVVEFDGVAHESTTTNCSQPAIAAARTMAEALHSSYLP